VPGYLRSAASKLGRIHHPDSVAALNAILERCAEIDEMSSRTTAGKQTDIARAYAMYSLARLSPEFSECHRIIEDHFAINRPVCIALARSKYQPLFKLFSDELVRLFSLYPSTCKSPELAATLATSHPGVAFLMNSRSDGGTDVVDEEFLNAMLDAAVILESTRSRKAFPVCKQMLRHDGSYLWEKLVYRAIARLRVGPMQRYDFLRKRLRLARSKENDKCKWDWTNQDSIVFSIRNTSAEAFLLLTMWHMPVSMKMKVADVLPSLESTSFTARAAAIDRMATTPQTTRKLARALQSKDVDTRRFLAVRLSAETNGVAAAMLRKLAEDGDEGVALEATKALGR